MLYFVINFFKKHNSVECNYEIYDMKLMIVGLPQLVASIISSYITTTVRELNNDSFLLFR
jgi:hypothetical protein